MSSPSHLVEVRCNICNSKEREIISQADTGNIVRCRRCGLFYRSRRLSDDDEISKYKNRLHDDSFCSIENAAKKEIFVSVLNRLEHHKGRILDIGCSNGFFLNLAKKRGWEPYGIEISDYFLRKTRESLGEKHIFGVPLKMAEFHSNFFDVITMWDVLDHLIDPLSELMEINRILKTKGLLIIRVRNMSFHTLINKLFKKDFLGIVKKPTVFHLYGFSNHNLRILLDKSHFTKVKMENSKLTVGDPYSQIVFLENFTINFIKRVYWASSEFVKFISFRNLLISPSIMVYAEKT